MNVFIYLCIVSIAAISIIYDYYQHCVFMFLSIHSLIHSFSHSFIIYYLLVVMYDYYHLLL